MYPHTYPLLHHKNPFSDKAILYLNLARSIDGTNQQFTRRDLMKTQSCAEAEGAAQ